MPTETLYIRVSQSRSRSRWGKTQKEIIEDIVSKIPLDARMGDVDIEAMMYKAGIIAAGHIKAAFVTKSRGGTDEARDRWQPLSPRYVAYKRAKRTKIESRRNSHPSQALTKKQQERWRLLYRQGLAMFKGDESHAARRAWFILKGEGAITLLDKYGRAQVDILRQTGQLLNSILPKVRNGEILVGSDLKYAAVHHYGTGHIPQRRLWPEPHKWPQSWWDDIARSIKDSLAEIISKKSEGK